jgi:hypothetical protein
VRNRRIKNWFRNDEFDKVNLASNDGGLIKNDHHARPNKLMHHNLINLCPMEYVCGYYMYYLTNHLHIQYNDLNIRTLS